MSASIYCLKRFTMLRLTSILVSSFIVLALLFSCSKKKDDASANVVPVGTPLDRESMLVNIADNIILPSYANFKGKLDLMITKSDNFRTAPTVSTLAEFRTAWKDAYIEWQKAAIYDFGPASDYALNSYLNVYPTNITTINSNIASGNVSLETFSSFSAQGFPAFDYLLNGLGNTDDEIITFYTTDADAAKRLAYILQLTTQMNSKFTSVYDTWTKSYRSTFVSKTSMDIYSSTSLMVNGIVFYYERYVRSGKFGIPSGAMINGTLQPTSVEAYYKKDIGLTLAKTAHQAFVDFFNGKNVNTGVEGASLKTYLNSLGAKDATTQVLLSTTINDQFKVISSKLDVLHEDLSNDVQTNNNAMIAVYNEMQKVVRMLKVDMSSAMSVTITYTDNDGD